MKLDIFSYNLWTFLIHWMISLFQIFADSLYDIIYECSDIHQIFSLFLTFHLHMLLELFRLFYLMLYFLFLLVFLKFFVSSKAARLASLVQYFPVKYSGFPEVTVSFLISPLVLIKLFPFDLLKLG